MKKILLSGGDGHLSQKIQKYNTKYKIATPSKKEMDVRDIDSVNFYVNSDKPDYFIHSGALTRPMIIHENNPKLSIESNIIGTANVVLTCMKYNVKLIYISTDCVYGGTKGNYTEEDGVKPFNKYGWSKLGGECSVMLYPNSLILRMGMLTNPFPHDNALVDMKKSLLYDDLCSQIILSLLDDTGIINVGGKSQSVYDFVSKANPDIGKISLKDVHDVVMPNDCSMDVTKMKEKLMATSDVELLKLCGGILK